MSEPTLEDPKHTVLVFEQGETAEDWDLEDKIFQADHSSQRTVSPNFEYDNFVERKQVKGLSL